MGLCPERRRSRACSLVLHGLSDGCGISGSSQYSCEEQKDCSQTFTGGVSYSVFQSSTCLSHVHVFDGCVSVS